MELQYDIYNIYFFKQIESNLEFSRLISFANYNQGMGISMSVKLE